jgi:hypothetical protein
MNTEHKNRPWWVKVALWGVPGRRSIVSWAWLSALMGIVFPLLGFYNPFFFFGALLLIAAFWYWAAIKWVDRYGQW